MEPLKPLLEVKNLCKTYIINKQQNHVLRNVSLTSSARYTIPC